MTQLYDVRRLELEAIAAALQPPPPIDYLAFAEEHVVFDGGPFPGPFNRALFPFFDEILRALSPSEPCRYVTLASSAQVGKTALATIFTLGAMTLGQGALLYAHPSEDNARRFSRMKLSPLMRSTAIVREVFPQRTRDTADSVFFKERRDGLASLLLTGANSPASLSQVTVNSIVMDDLSKWTINSAGDPEIMAESRARAISDAKILKISTPLLNPGCRITRSFEAGSREMPFVPCPHCSAMQVLEWPNMEALLDPAHPERAGFSCVACGGIIEEKHRPGMLRGFEWRAENSNIMSQHRSFWIWSAYSPLQSWEQVAREWLRVKGDTAGEQSFTNDTLGKAFEPRGIGRPWEELRDRAAKSPYARGAIPKGCLVLTLGIDVQGDRVEWIMLGFGREYRRFMIDYGVIFGDISDENCQDNLDALLKRKWTNSCGKEMPISLASIDANFMTDSVLEFARRYSTFRLIAVRGANSEHAPRIARVERERNEKLGVVLKGSDRFFNIGVSQFKISLYRDLSKDDPQQPGYVSFPTGCEDRLFQEICGETRVLHLRMGMPFYRWEKVSAHQATEMLDALIYATAAGLKCGVNAISDEGWNRLEAKFEPAPSAVPLPAPVKRTMADFGKLV